jgi:hypothetical protein
MTRHIFKFDGGDDLTTMGASWFVSYLFYYCKDKSHVNWQKISTDQSRISVFNRTKNFHKYWLEKILEMNNHNLNKNEIGLNAKEIKEMVKVLLKK